MREHAIRLAEEGDLERLRVIERSAAAIFREVGLDEVADLPAMPLSELYRACVDGRLHVACEEGRPIGFAMTSIVDREPYLEELDVDPAHQRRGVGRALLEHACAEGRRRGFSSITLHTFRDVPWNAPFYARAGFEIVDRSAMGPELGEKHDLDAARFGPVRVCMRRALHSSE